MIDGIDWLEVFAEVAAILLLLGFVGVCALWNKQDSIKRLDGQEK